MAVAEKCTALLQSTKQAFWFKVISELLPKCKEHVNEAESPPFNVYPFKKPLLSPAEGRSEKCQQQTP